MSKVIKLPPVDCSKSYGVYGKASDQYKALKASKTGFSNLRKKLLIKQNFKCIYCLCDLHEKRANVEHITPVKRGGSNDITNLAMACHSCNKSKGNSVKKKWRRTVNVNGKVLKKERKDDTRLWLKGKREEEYIVHNELAWLVAENRSY